MQIAMTILQYINRQLVGQLTNSLKSVPVVIVRFSQHEMTKHPGKIPVLPPHLQHPDPLRLERTIQGFPGAEEMLSSLLHMIVSRNRPFVRRRDTMTSLCNA